MGTYKALHNDNEYCRQTVQLRILIDLKSTIKYLKRLNFKPGSCLNINGTYYSNTLLVLSIFDEEPYTESRPT